MAGIAVPQWDLAVFDQFKQAVMAAQGCTEEEAVVALGEMSLGARGGVLTQYITNTLQGNGQRT
jgi:hypothetical protein